MNFIRLFVCGAFLFTLAACSQNVKTGDLEPSATTKKYIDLSGYALPNVAFIQNNLAAMEANKPFDGIVFRVDPANGFNSNRTATFLETARWTSSSIDFNALTAIPWNKFKHNFIRLDTTDGSYSPDWFSDTRWNQITDNMKLFAKIAKTSNSRGIVFDPEPYGYNPWDYSAAEYPGQTFAQVYAQVRKRGAQTMAAWQSEYPDIQILMLFGLTIVREQTERYGGDQSKAPWGLWGAFIDGMLGAMNPTSRLIEGNENSYYYKSAADFENFRDYKSGARTLLSNENRTKYDTQMNIAHSVYTDNVLNLWKSPRLFGYYLASDVERRLYAVHNFYHALKNSDQYVWVYNENMDWWGTKGQGVNIPSTLLSIMQRAKSRLSAGQGLSFSVTAAVGRATFEYDRRVWMDGYIYKNNLDFYVRVRSGPAIGVEREDTACNTYNNHPDYWYYDCAFPYGWSGTLTPSDSEVGFTPGNRTYTNLTQYTPSQNFSAKP
jgi:hypothetical protein